MKRAAHYYNDRDIAEISAFASLLSCNVSRLLHLPGARPYIESDSVNCFLRLEIVLQVIEILLDVVIRAYCAIQVIVYGEDAGDDHVLRGHIAAFPISDVHDSIDQKCAARECTPALPAGRPPRHLRS